MKKLIVVRHGEDGAFGALSQNGFEQIQALAKKLNEIVNGLSVFVFTSPTLRTKETAKIISKTLNTEYKVEECLEHEEDFADSLKLVRSRVEDVVILVTHLEYTEWFPSYFAKENMGIYLKSYGIDKGRAWIVDCENKTIELL